MKKYFFRSSIAMLTLTLVLISCNKDNEIGEFSNSEIEGIEANAQFDSENPRGCGMEAHMNVLMQDPAFAARQQAKVREVMEMGDYRAACSNKVIIPVAVHYQRLKGQVNQACLIALAQNQVDILNDDYGGTNFDISNWTNGSSSLFGGVSNGEACIEFCLANKNHPSGYGLSDGDLAVTFNDTRGDRSSDWSGYINIFVRNIQYLGYSPLGGSGNGDGVVIDDNAFGSGSGCGSVSPGAPYNLGRTLTHELGHYLLLDHIWGGGCGSDDGVGDTPDSSGPYYGCPANGASSCGSTDMHMNYMDYTNDACMYMFSAGQATRMENYVGSNLGNVVANGAVVCGEVDPPCTDCPCEAPTGFSVTKRGKKTTISWSSTADADSYEIELTAPGGSVSTSSTTSTSVNYNKLSSGSYSYRVRSICGGSPSAWSSTQSFNQ